MRTLILSSFMLSWFYTSDITPASTTGVDRCHIDNCLCEVRPGPRATAMREEIRKRSLSLFFREDQYILSKEQREEARLFFSKFENGSSTASIIGYTDGCGSFEYNKILSSKRAEEVFGIARNHLRASAIGRISGGEKSKGHLGEARRVDIIVHTRGRVTTAIEKIPADYYLIDASGSMWGKYRNWNDVISVSVKPNSKVFLSITGGCRDGQYMSDVRPHGGTEIWWSYWNIIDKMNQGETLLIVSDFKSQVPLSSRESFRIKEKAREAGVSVSAFTP